VKPIKVETAAELGQLLRDNRVAQRFTLERVSGMTNIGMRFLSELERGKETAQLGKVLQIIHQLGLEVIIQPRGQ
jgi:HTH-type transcriptional regulator/antitoxin HipB